MYQSLKIQTTSFGLITINGRQYTSDLVIYPDGLVEDTWWRKSGHRLSMDDIEKLVAARPEVIIVGTGVRGMMKPDPGLGGMLSDRAIEMIALPNPDAIDLFNSLSSQRKVGACFHLTC